LAIKEVLINGQNAVIVNSEKPEKWVKEIEILFNNLDEQNKLSQNALNDAGKYTWDNREKNI